MGERNAQRKTTLALSTFKSIEEDGTLFSYETCINEDNLVLNCTSQIYRNKKYEFVRGKRLQIVTKQNAMNGDLPDFNYQMLFSVNFKQQDGPTSFSITKSEKVKDQQLMNAQLLQNLPYVSLSGHGRCNQATSHVITEGDVIKTGKTYFKVLQTHLSKKKVAQLPQNNKQTQCQQSKRNDQLQQGIKACRICFMEGEQHEELHSLCSCKGSCKFLHLSCLKEWFQNKVKTENNRFVTSYYLSKFQCEICKTPLRNKINVKGKQEFFVQLKKPNEPYIVLQKIELESQQKTVFVLTPKQVGVRIGRGNISEMRIQDQRIQRAQSLIEFRRGEFVITDLGSQFGTLLLLRNHMKFQRTICVQLRNKMYKLEVIPPIHPQAQYYLY